MPLTVLRTPRPRSGPARARNIGWRATSAPLVAFTDDDCVPQPGWLAALVSAGAQADVVQGLTDADPSQAPGSGPFARMIVITRPSWKFETCNIAYRRQLLDRLDGFDERFPAPFGEDLDLGWRAMSIGAQVGWSQRAVVHHAVEHHGRLRDWLGWLRYASRCEWFALVLREHRGMRRHLTLGCFYKPYHLFVLLLAAGVAVARRSAPAALLLALPWLAYRTAIAPRPAPRKWLWAVLPMSFAVDAAEVAATVRGAIRHRTVVL